MSWNGIGKQSRTGNGNGVILSGAGGGADLHNKSSDCVLENEKKMYLSAAVERIQFDCFDDKVKCRDGRATDEVKLKI